MYINAKSNHLRYVVNQILKSTNKRFTTISKDEYPLKIAKEHYQEALIKRTISTSWYLTLKRALVIKGKTSSTSLFPQRLKQKSVNDFLKLLAEILTQRTRTIFF